MQNRLTLRKAAPNSTTPSPSTVSLAKAYYMVKESLNDPDASALLSHSITTSPTAQGVISDTGAGDGSSLLSFVVSETALNALDPARAYLYVVKVILSNGRTATPADPVAPVRVLDAGVVATN